MPISTLKAPLPNGDIISDGKGGKGPAMAPTAYRLKVPGAAYGGKPYKISDGKAYFPAYIKEHDMDGKPAPEPSAGTSGVKPQVGGTSWQNPRNWSRRHARGAKASGKRGDREEGEISDGELSISSLGSATKKIRQGVHDMKGPSASH